MLEGKHSRGYTYGREYTLWRIYALKSTYGERYIQCRVNTIRVIHTYIVEDTKGRVYRRWRVQT